MLAVVRRGPSRGILCLLFLPGVLTALLSVTASLHHPFKFTSGVPFLYLLFCNPVLSILIHAFLFRPTPDERVEFSLEAREEV